MKIREVIELLQDVNPEAEFDVIAMNRPQKFTWSRGGGEGCAPKNCESFGPYLDALNANEMPSTPVAAPQEKPCPHVTLKRQNCGSAHWYICHECEQKFKAVEWDGAVRVLTPLSELVDKITPENLHPEQRAGAAASESTSKEKS